MKLSTKLLLFGFARDRKIDGLLGSLPGHRDRIARLMRGNRRRYGPVDHRRFTIAIHAGELEADELSELSAEFWIGRARCQQEASA